MIALAALALNLPTCAHRPAAPAPEAAAEEGSGDFTVRSAPTNAIESGAIPEPAAEPEAAEP
jgi:hypothetical protein